MRAASSKTPHVAGLDGCRAGWFVTVSDCELADPDCFVATDIESAMAGLVGAVSIAIDIPIGLPDSGPRSCDLQARSMLPRQRKSSVFPAPIRPVLAAKSHAEASGIRQSIEGKGMSLQAFHIMPKIIEVDSFVRESTQCLFEAHPEIAFMSMNAGEAVPEKKSTRPGFAARYELLAERVDRRAIDDALRRYPRKSVSRDDVVDAFAMLVVAARRQAGAAQRIPDSPERDRLGLDMAIWY